MTLTSPGRLVTAWCRDGLQRVVDVMRQFLGFNSSFNINSMLIGG